MTMKRFALIVAALLAAAAVHAQVFEWKDETGKTHYSDMPPPGNVRELRKIESAPPVTGSPTQKTAADREMEFRKNLKDSQEKTEKASKQQAAAAERNENCDNARRQLQLLESGERIALRDDKGERYYMDDAQRAQEIVKARQAVQSSCK
jgi:hypothetical protein